MLAYRRNLAPIPPPVSEPSRKRVEIPDSITDPLAREILEVVRRHPKSWLMIEVSADVGHSAVRYWFYRPTFNPHFGMVQAVLAALGYRLRLERIQPGETA